MTKEQAIAIREEFKKDFKEEPATNEWVHNFRSGVIFALNLIINKWDEEEEQ